MKKLILLSLGFLVSCSSTEYVVDKENISASVEVLNRINFIEGQLKRHLNGKRANFNLVNDIVSLSGIQATVHSSSWIGVSYIPNNNDIVKWKKWHEENKERFYFEVYDSECTKLLGLERRVINYKMSSGQIKKSILYNCDDIKLSKVPH